MPNYADAAACASTCAADYPTTGLGNDAAGNTVQCRIYHLGVAGSDGATSAATHCPHGGPDGGGVCVGAVTQPGDTCEDPIVVTALPYSDTNSTGHFANNYSCVGGGAFGENLGDNALDGIYAFTAAADGKIVVSVDASFDSGLYLLDGCSATPTCAQSDDGLGSGETLSLTVVAGTTYYFGVDGYSPIEEQGAYVFTIEALCTGDECTAPKGPGDTCNNAITITGSTTGDTTNSSDQFATPASCGTEGGAGLPDIFYQYTAPATGTFTLSYSATSQLATIALLTGCGDVATQCIQSSGDIYQGKGTFQVDLVQDTTYIFALDGLFQGDVGTFDLTIDVPTAAPTYTADIQPVLATKCTPCHTGGSSGGHNIASTYSEVTKANSGGAACAGTTTVGECAVKRILNGSMPLGGPVLSQELKDLFQAWADGGFLEN